MSQWSRPHQEKTPETCFMNAEYADTSPGVKGDVVLWPLEGAPLSTDMSATPIPGIYGKETTYLTGIRVIRAHNSNSVTHGRTLAGILDQDIEGAPFGTLFTRIHKFVRIQCWGPAVAKVNIVTDGGIYTPLVNSTTDPGGGDGDGAFSDVTVVVMRGAAEQILSVGALLAQPVTPPFTGLARVFLKCV